jgi:sec-independent protein translocase protein TatA
MTADGFPVHFEREVTMTYGVLFAIGPITSPITLAVVGIIALLLFGNRLPSVMRSLGRSVVEFKKGVNGVEEEINDVVRSVDDKAKTTKEDAEA